MLDLRSIDEQFTLVTTCESAISPVSARSGDHRCLPPVEQLWRATDEHVAVRFLYRRRVHALVGASSLCLYTVDC